MRTCVCVCVWVPQVRMTLCLISGLLSQDALIEQWNKKPVYVVGGATANAVQSLGLSPQGEETGQADKLAELIIESSTYPMETHKHMFIHIVHSTCTDFTCALTHALLCTVCISLQGQTALYSK